MNLGTLDDPKLVKIAKDLGKYEANVKDLLLRLKDVFAFPYVCEHKIELQPEAKPVQQMRYRMSLNYVAKIKEEINKNLKVGFISLVDGM